MIYSRRFLHTFSVLQQLGDTFTLLSWEHVNLLQNIYRQTHFSIFYDSKNFKILFKICVFFQLEFLKIYLDESLAGTSKAISYDNEKRQQEKDALLREVDGFFVVCNLLWALWSMNSSVTTKITFGHWVRKN